MEAETRGFASPHWLTFQQAKQYGGCVRKGETGTSVVFYRTWEKRTIDDETGAVSTSRIPCLKEYTVFNAGQCDGLPARFLATPDTDPSSVAADERVLEFVGHTGAVIVEGGDRACYSPILDCIRMPFAHQFESSEAHAGTLLHEAVHWTGHARRLDRLSSTKRWGDDSYALEELVAELGAAFLSADLGLASQPREDHASYVAAWLKVLKRDARAILGASAAASRAADFLHALQPGGSDADVSAGEHVVAVS
jgi:antirestriction protein ArdC